MAGNQTVANSLTDSGSSDLITVAVAAESNEELAAGLEEDFAQMAAAQGRVLVRLGEVARRQSFRDEGATSLETWAVERFGVSVPTARAYVHVAEKADQVPHLVGALCDGEVSLDKVRAVLDVATPSTEGALCEQAKACGVRELSEIAQMSAARQAAQRPAPVRSEHDRRYLRFNDTFKTMTVQLPAESYAQTKACLEARAREIPSDDEVPSEVERPLKGKTPSGPVAPAGTVSSAGRRRWDQRLHDAFIDLIATGGAKSAPSSGTPFFVVAHVALSALVQGRHRLRRADRAGRRARARRVDRHRDRPAHRL